MGHSPVSEAVVWDDRLTAAKNVARNVVSMEDADDWAFIEDIVKDKSVVILGEQMHFDLTSNIARVGLLRKLHDCGFRTLVFEMAPMLSGYAFGRLPSGSRITLEELLGYGPSGVYSSDSRDAGERLHAFFRYGLRYCLLGFPGSQEGSSMPIRRRTRCRSRGFGCIGFGVRCRPIRTIRSR